MAKSVAEASVLIGASRERVWEALTRPELIREYFLGATVDTDWQVGSAITFTGEWNGKPFEDKGEILTFEPFEALSYSHWSSMSGAADTPENYHVVTIKLIDTVGGTAVVLTQSNLTGEATESDQKNRNDYEQTWRALLDGLKTTVETQAIEKRT